MNLNLIHSVQDAGDRFVVHHATRGTFPVSKHGLDKQTHDAIQAMCSGGAVKGYATGGPVFDAMSKEIPNMGSATAPGLASPPVYYGPEEQSSIVKVLNSPVGGGQPVVNGVVPPVSAPTPVGQVDAPATLDARQQAQQQSIAPVSPTVTQKPFDPFAGMPQMPTGRGSTGLKEQQAANDRLAGVDTAQQNEQHQNDLQYAQMTNEAKASGDAEFTRLKQAHEKLASDIASTKIDPNRLWHNASVGGKIASTLGILLSGIGAGMSNKPNLAIETVNKMVDQDIEAQKADLGKKESLLSDNLKETGDLREAQNLTRMQLLTTFQAQTAATASKFGGAKAQAMAQALSGQIQDKIDEHAAQSAQSVYANKMDIFKMKAAYNMQQNAAQQQAEAYGAFANRQGEAQHINALPEKERELVVNTPYGKMGMATSSEAKKQYDEVAIGVQDLNEGLKRLNALAEQAKGGAFSPELRSAIASQTAQMRLTMGKGAEGLSRYTPQEAEEYGKILKNIADYSQTYSGYKAAADQLGKSLDTKLSNADRQYLRPMPVRR